MCIVQWQPIYGLARGILTNFLTVYLDVECLLGNWRDTVVCFAHVFPHVFSADLSNVKYRSYLVGNWERVSGI